MKTISHTEKDEESRKRERSPLVYMLSIAALFIAMAGLFAAGVLSAGHLLGLPVPCGQSSGCMTIAMHPSSKILGIPIAYFGFIAYLIIIYLLWQMTDTRLAQKAVVGLTGAGTIVSISLLIYSQRVIEATCPWCNASGAAMTLLFVLSMLILRQAPPLPAIRPFYVGTLMIATVTAIGVQAGLIYKKAEAPPVPAALLVGMGVNELIDEEKSLGPKDAPVMIIEFADLMGPACRHSHSMLMQYRKDHPAGVRLIFRHLPLYQIKGHEYSRAAAALSQMAAEKGRFWQFVNAVYAVPGMKRESFLSLMKALGFDPEEVERRIVNQQDPAIERVLKDEEIAARLAINSTPTFIVLIRDMPLVSANQRTLSRILNSTTVQAALSQAARSMKGTH